MLFKSECYSLLNFNVVMTLRENEILNKAVAIAKENGYQKISVISGVGVRNYYQKLGYELKDTYMSKQL